MPNADWVLAAQLLHSSFLPDMLCCGIITIGHVQQPHRQKAVNQAKQVKYGAEDRQLWVHLNNAPRSGKVGACNHCTQN